LIHRQGERENTEALPSGDCPFGSECRQSSVISNSPFLQHLISVLAGMGWRALNAAFGAREARCWRGLNHSGIFDERFASNGVSVRR
jgi:hypothetical protein